jgi:hypothetical protein
MKNYKTTEGIMRKLGLFLTASLLSTAASATTIGVSAHPFTMQKQVVTTEFNNYANNGAGTGMTARYFNRINEVTSIDGGFGITDGDRSNRLFVGADFQMIPDYGRQPRISLKGLLETESLNGDRINAFGVAPTISKGFAFWGKEAFPFIALPMKVALNTDTNTYETSTALAAGITGRLPIDGYQKLVGNIETNVSLRNSYSSIVFGLSLPIQ